MNPRKDPCTQWTALVALNCNLKRIARFCPIMGKPSGDAYKKDTADHHNELQYAKIAKLCHNIAKLLADQSTPHTETSTTSANKQTPTDTISKCVGFFLQNHNNEVETHRPDSRPATDQPNPGVSKEASNNATPSTKSNTRITIPALAEPAWNSAKCHFGGEQKAQLRADHLENLLGQ